MKVCTHINGGSQYAYENQQKNFESISVARQAFRDSLYVRYADPKSDNEMPVMDVYVLADNETCDCNSHMNFHDYPSKRFTVGPRGGVKEVSV
ncbi:hypothetical protein SEA_KEELAN_72 [Gordonia phage Keelan]|nr:hypothetical protein SEA_KEELAN_72 [Gordonia phage Keelan]